MGQFNPLRNKWNAKNASYIEKLKKKIMLKIKPTNAKTLPKMVL